MRQVLFGAGFNSAGDVGYAFDNTIGGSSALDDTVYRIWPLSGVFRNLCTRLVTAPGGSTSRTFTLEIDDVLTALETTHGGTSTAERNVSAAVAITAGQLVRLRGASSGSVASNTALYFTVEFESADPAESACTTAALGFTCPFTGEVFAGSIANVEAHMPCDGTITFMNATLPANALAGGNTITFHLYKNGVKQDGTGGTVDTTLTLADVAAGEVVEATFSLAFVKGDRIALDDTDAGSPTRTINPTVGLVVNAGTGRSILCGTGAASPADPSDTADAYMSLNTARNWAFWPSSIDVLTKRKGGVSDLTVQELYVSILSAATPGSRRFRVLKNGSVPTAGPDVTIPTGGTLLGSDATGAVSFVEGDDVGPLMHTPSGTPSVTGFERWSMVVVAEVVPPGGGGDVDDTVVDPAAADLGTGITRVFVRFTFGQSAPYEEVAVAETDLSDPASWFGGPKRGLLLNISEIVRELAETVRGTEVTVLVAEDETRPWRTRAATSTMSGALCEIFVVEDAVRYALGEPYRLFAGLIVSHRQVPGWQYEFTVRDVLSERLATLADAPRLPPGKLTVVSFPAMDAEYEGRAIPLVIGECNDTTEPGTIPQAAQGVIPPMILATINLQTAFGGVDRDVFACILSQGALPASGVWEAFYNPINNPYVRIPVPASVWGADAWAPGMPGWASTGIPTDYLDYPASPSSETRRYTVIFISATGGVYSQAFKDGKVLVAFNVFGVSEHADGTGNYLSDAPRIWQWLLVNYLFTEYRTGNYAQIPTFAGGHSILDVASVSAATTTLRGFGGGSYPVGFMLGAEGAQVTLRHVLDELCAGVLMEQGIDRHGRLMVSVEDPSAPAVAEFSALDDIEGDTFESPLERGEFRNVIEYVYGYRYLPPSAPVEAPAAGEALPTSPVPPYLEWTSGLKRLPSAEGLASNGDVERTLFVENRVVRAEAVADDVASRLLARRVGPGPAYEGPRSFTFTTSWQGLQQNGVPIELGTVIAVTHLEGLGGAGWSARRGRVLRIAVDPLTARVTLSGRVLGDEAMDT
ncbi:MAG: hypothetical protein AB7O32_00530 [Vicinamibacterales bacterium]